MNSVVFRFLTLFYRTKNMENVWFDTPPIVVKCVSSLFSRAAIERKMVKKSRIVYNVVIPVISLQTMLSLLN